MSGRSRNPGELPPHKLYRSYGAFMASTQTAVIMDVNEANGTCTISFDCTPGERPDVLLPFYVHFSEKGKRRKTAWSRYMPQPGDTVYVGFDSNGEAKILGFAPIGYSRLAEIQDEEGKFGFRDLKAGEWDMKSAGGAYFKGDNLGNLFMAGGMSSITLDKKNYEMRTTSGRVRESLGTSMFRRGVVKRAPIPFQPEIQGKATVGVLPLDKLGPASAVLTDLYEFTADIRAAINPSSFLAQKVAFFSLGNVLDPTFSLPVVGDAYGAAGPLGIMKFKINPTANARFLLRIYDSVPLTDQPIGTEGPIGGTPARPFEMGVDQLGDTYINVSSVAVQGFNVWAPTQLSLSSNVMQLNGNVFLGGTPAAVAPGALPVMNSLIANQPLVCGTLFSVALSAYMSAVAAFATVAATGTAVTSPADAVAYCKALGTAGSALGTAAAAFTASVPSWLSASAFCAPSAIGPGVVPPISPFLL